MKKVLILLLTIAALCIASGCATTTIEDSDIPLSSTPPSQVSELPADVPSVPSPLPPHGLTEEFFGYKYTVPAEITSESVHGGALYDTESWDLFVYGLDYLEFSSWDEIVEQCKSEMFNGIFSAVGYLPYEQTAVADVPYVNAHGIELMRVVGEFTGEDGDTPYIACYYVTDEGYVRFIVCLNYENEAGAAEVMDYVADWLEKA